jgi:ABC-2 type transport system permease protein
MGSAHLLEMLGLIVYDLVFLGLLTAALILLAMYRRAAYAVMKRNFVGYFSNPTGYVFLCLFVLLTSIASFWPHEFFVANLANLDQLNTLHPLDPADLHAGHHDEHLGRRTPPRDR